MAVISVNSRTPTLLACKKAVDLLDLFLTSVVRRKVGTLIKHTASCIRSVKLSSGATLIIPAVRVQYTHTSTSSNRLQAEPSIPAAQSDTISALSCLPHNQCAFMLVEHTCSTIRHCCRSWRARKNPPQRLRQSKSLARVLTLTSKTARFCTIGISTWPVKQVFEKVIRGNVLQGEDVIRNVSEPNAYCLNIAYLMDIPQTHHSYTLHISLLLICLLSRLI